MYDRFVSKEIKIARFIGTVKMIDKTKRFMLINEKLNTRKIHLKPKDFEKFKQGQNVSIAVEKNPDGGWNLFGNL